MRSQRRFVDRIERQELLAEQSQGLAGLIVEPGHVGPEPPGGGQVRIDFHGPAERGIRLIDMEVFHGQFGQGDMHLGRAGIDFQGRLELLGGIRPIVLLLEEQPGLEVGWPVVRIELLGRGKEVVHEGVELVAEPIPAGVLGGGAADPTQRLGLLDIMIVVELDQAVIVALGLVQAAGGAGQFGPDVKRQGMLGGQFQGLIDTAAGLGRIAALEGQPGQLGLDFRLLGGQRLEGLDRGGRLALRLQASGPAECGRRRGAASGL